MYGYFWVLFMFVAMNIIGIVLHIALYIIDMTKFDGILDKVEKDEKLDALMTSPGKPAGEIIRQSMGKSKNRMDLVEY